ncbi:hypothetical protein BOTBODRAFT_392939 [Botryobasidium botryosum FD-172 SS1]|uniref:Uncharacterized protein n=1 Tax=Botryobasidium botryosum (strain FD-172 SS1) TaxID=930990 RepID=A0A067N033_BOTB1|nr:hypothetical protein BOTBODRAFT_392939 [Botryobasidium botryosum FD-172 SS1]
MAHRRLADPLESFFDQRPGSLVLAQSPMQLWVWWSRANDKSPVSSPMVGMCRGLESLSIRRCIPISPLGSVRLIYLSRSSQGYVAMRVVKEGLLAGSNSWYTYETTASDVVIYQGTACEGRKDKLWAIGGASEPCSLCSQRGPFGHALSLRWDAQSSSYRIVLDTRLRTRKKRFTANVQQYQWPLICWLNAQH